MRIVQIYNRRRVWGGEDRMVETILALLEKNQDTVLPWIRDNAELGDGLTGRSARSRAAFIRRELAAIWLRA